MIKLMALECIQELEKSQVTEGSGKMISSMERDGRNGKMGVSI